jgi:CBS domain-containing protein
MGIFINIDSVYIPMNVDLRVGDIMTVGVITLPSDSTVEEAAKLLRKTKVGCIIVTKNKKAKGIVTERDLVYKVVAAGIDPKKTKLERVMTTPLKMIVAGEKIDKAALMLKEKKVKRLPVVNKKKQLVGIITEGDLMRAYPGLLDLLLEDAEIRRFPKSEVFSGVCDECGLHSDKLIRIGEKLFCEECREEEEV